MDPKPSVESGRAWKNGGVNRRAASLGGWLLPRLALPPPNVPVGNPPVLNSRQAALLRDTRYSQALLQREHLRNAFKGAWSRIGLTRIYRF